MISNPFDLLGGIPSPVAERRELTVFGSPVELAFIPTRGQRRNVPGQGRPPFRADFGRQILESEATWRDAGVAWTPNKFPFGRDHGILWRDGDLQREADETLLCAAFEITSTHGGTALGNCIGSAASIQRAHVHIVRERLSFLSSLPVEPWTDDVTAVDAEVETGRLAASRLPFAGVRLRGSPPARAAATARWIARRLTAAFNLVDDGEATWVFPRGAETPAPHFPFALGAAELWGRWCYAEHDAFAAATADGLERAIEAACVRWPDA